MANVLIFKGSSCRESSIIWRPFLLQNFHYLKAVFMAKLPIFEGSSYGKTSTIQRQFLLWKFHYLKAVFTAKLPLFKGSFYGKTSTIQRQFLLRKFHHSKAVLTAKFLLFKGKSYSANSVYSKADQKGSYHYSLVFHESKTGFSVRFWVFFHWKHAKFLSFSLKWVPDFPWVLGISFALKHKVFTVAYQFLGLNKNQIFRGFRELFYPEHSIFSKLFLWVLGFISLWKYAKSRRSFLSFFGN